MMRLSDQIARIVFLVCAALIIAVIVGVFYFVGSRAFLVFFQPGGTSLKEFFTSTTWDPAANLNDNPSYGAWGLIEGSLIITFFSVIIATPLSFGMALFMTEVTPPRLA